MVVNVEESELDVSGEEVDKHAAEREELATNKLTSEHKTEDVDKLAADNEELATNKQTRELRNDMERASGAPHAGA